MKTLKDTNNHAQRQTDRQTDKERQRERTHIDSYGITSSTVY